MLLGVLEAGRFGLEGSREFRRFRLWRMCECLGLRVVAFLGVLIRIILSLGTEGIQGLPVFMATALCRFERFRPYDF